MAGDPQVQVVLEDRLGVRASLSRGGFIGGVFRELFLKLWRIHSFKFSFSIWLVKRHLCVTNVVFSSPLNSLSRAIRKGHIIQN